MKIKISKSQWESIGNKTGWVKMAKDNPPKVSPDALQSPTPMPAGESCSVCGGPKGQFKDDVAKVKWDQYNMCQRCQNRIS